ncbi:MAG: amidohydrolase [Bryobacterales bacterium]|nr:amidohydrolase [Bryobacteraceae bacterium]MDW8355645.1 amidohydrolase [Bryobacterales bacterium]
MRRSRLLTALCAAGWLYAESPRVPDALVDADLASLEALYIHLHRNPELSLEEKRTAERIASELRAAGFEVTTGVGGHGVVGVMRNGRGPTVMVRTDMDALPVTEKTGLPYASTVRTRDAAGREVGVMHACGHDMHMTVFVGTARLLARLKDRWRGTVLLVAQPAEELGSGAAAMLNDGLFTRFPRPDYALALHVDAALEAGKIGYREGFVFANVDSVDITLYGVGGHGAYPHLTKDPIVLAAQVILALQTIVSREVRPLDPAVVTVGSIHGGTKHNIIPDQVDLQLTVRSFSEETRERILSAIRRITVEMAQAAGVPPDRAPITRITPDAYTPATYNDPALVRRLVPVWKRELGDQNVVERDPEMGGEDFSRYGRLEPKIPLVLFRLGVIDPPRMPLTKPSLHSPEFWPARHPTIETGVKAMTAAVLELLSE